MTAWARPLQREESLRMPDLPLSPASRANLRFGAGLGAVPSTGVARDRSGYADLSALATESFFESEFHVVAQIGTAFAAGPAAAPCATHPEKIIEYIGER